MNLRLGIPLLLAGCLIASSALAQNTETPTRTKAGDTSRARAGAMDGKTRGANIRASKLMGMNIQNSAGESVGAINDVVLDANTGKVRYAAVTYGGFLGIGNKMFAVPFEAFQCKVDPNDKQNHVLVLNVTQQSLEGAMGFDEDHWPDFADKKMTMELDKRYGIDRTLDRDTRLNVNVNRDGVDVDLKRELDKK